VAHSLSSTYGKGRYSLVREFGYLVSLNGKIGSGKLWSEMILPDLQRRFERRVSCFSSPQNTIRAGTQTSCDNLTFGWFTKPDITTVRFLLARSCLSVLPVVLPGAQVKVNPNRNLSLVAMYS